MSVTPASQFLLECPQQLFDGSGMAHHRRRIDATEMAIIAVRPWTEAEERS
jgi:hypothetical protein